MKKVLPILFLIAIGVAVVLSGCTNPLVPAVTPTPTPVPTLTPTATPTPTPVPTATPQPTAIITIKPGLPVVIWNQNTTVEVRYFHYLCTNTTVPAGTKMHIELTSNNPVDFLLLDESNFFVYQESVKNLTPMTFTPLIMKNVVTAVSEDFVIQNTAKYYFVFDNTGALDPSWAPIYNASLHVVITEQRLG